METRPTQPWIVPSLECWPTVHRVVPGEHGAPPAQSSRAEVVGQQSSGPRHHGAGPRVCTVPSGINAHALCIRAPCSHLWEETHCREASGSPDVSGLWGAPRFWSGNQTT